MSAYLFHHPLYSGSTLLLLCLLYREHIFMLSRILTWIFSFIMDIGIGPTELTGSGVDHITGPGLILTRTTFPVLFSICLMNTTGYRLDTGRYLMDTSKITGEDGSGKDIGNMMQDGGKAGTEGTAGTMTSMVGQPPDHQGHLHLMVGHPDHLTMEAAVLVANNVGRV